MRAAREAASADSVLAAVAVNAVMAARWEAADLLSRKPASEAPDLLRALAAELAMSAAGRDQLRSLALTAAAEDVAQGRAALADGALFFFGEAAEPARRLQIQRLVFGRRQVSDAGAGEVVKRLEAQHRRETGGGAAEVSAGLIDDARLHKALWDDPRIPADSPTRLAMLCSVPRLVDRARELDPMRLRALHSLVRWARPRDTGKREV